jgi:lycopene cyclase domain-containing protein
MTYLLLNLFFTAAAIVAGLALYPKRLRKVAMISLMPLLVATAVFDNLIVGFGIVAYDTSKICGIYVGVVPIEDFCYSIAAVWLVPAVWRWALKRRYEF